MELRTQQINNQLSEVQLQQGTWILEIDPNYSLSATNAAGGVTLLSNYTNKAEVRVDAAGSIWVKADTEDGIETTLKIQNFFFEIGGGAGGTSQGGGSSQDLSNYVKKNSQQPQTIESDLVLGASKNLSILNPIQKPEQAVPRSYIDLKAGEAGSFYFDYTSIPQKQNLLLNLTGDTIKNGYPMSGSNTSFESAIPNVAAINLQYDEIQNQTTFGVTSGFGDTNRGYDKENGFWWIGRQPRINFLDISSFNLTQATGLTIELEFEITELPVENYTSLFAIATNSNPSTNPAQDQYRSTNNFNVVWGEDNYWAKDKRDTNLISNGIGNGGINTRIKMVFTIEGQTLKAYRDYQLRGSGTLENYAQETYKYILLNRGAYFGRNRRFANMKIFKLRLWKGVLTEQEVASLANLPAPSFGEQLNFQAPLQKQGNSVSLNAAELNLAQNQGFTDLQSQVTIQESQIQDLELLLPIAPKLVYKCSDLPNKNQIQLNLTPAVIKNGAPMDGNNLDFDSVISHDPTLFNLQYDNNQNQQSFGVTTGFNDNNRGYDRRLGFWYIGRDPRINFINIANLNLTQATGLTIELEFEITNSPRDNFTSLFSIVTNSDISTNPAQDQYRSTNNFNVVYGSNNYWCKDKRDADLISNGLGITGGVNQRNKMLFTIQGTALKAYKDYQHRGNGTLENYASETYKYILLNRGTYFGNNRIFANMKIWKLRLWRGVLTPEQITSLANM